VMIMVVIVVVAERPRRKVLVGAGICGGCFGLQGNAAGGAKSVVFTIRSVARGAQAAFMGLRRNNVPRFLCIGIKGESLNRLEGRGDGLLAKIGAAHVRLQAIEKIVDRLVRLTRRCSGCPIRQLICGL